MDINPDGTPASSSASENTAPSQLGDRTFDTLDQAMQVPLRDEDETSEQAEAVTDEVEDTQEPEATLEEAPDEVEETGTDEGEEYGTEPEAEQNSDNSSETEVTEEPYVEDDVRVTLSNGEEIPLGELKNGYFRQADYTGKMQELAQGRQAVEQQHMEVTQRAELLQQQLQGFTAYLENLVPEQPDINLLQTNPQQYHIARAQREAVLAELGEAMAFKEQIDQSIGQVNEQNYTREIQANEATLLRAMPKLQDPGALQSFRSANEQTAKEFGFSDEEITSGPQLLETRTAMILHYARLGRQAEKNRQNAKRRITQKPAKAKAKASAPVPQKEKARRSTNQNRKALQQLSKTGSIRDAMKIDFD